MIYQVQLITRLSKANRKCQEHIFTLIGEYNTFQQAETQAKRYVNEFEAQSDYYKEYYTATKSCRINSISFETCITELS